MRVDDSGGSPDLRGGKFRLIPRAQSQQYVIEQRKGWGVDLFSLHVIQEEIEDRQLIDMSERGVPESGIYIDKQSGKDFKRPQYRKQIKKLRPVTSSALRA